MSRKLAIKQLTQSDLTLFEWHFRNHNAGNQKAINLNADVFINILYPILPELAKENQGRIPLYLEIYGPDTNVVHSLQRKIIKFGAYKNWRLNGEFIHNPDENTTRYNILKPLDLVVFEFFGIDMPKSAKVVFIANNLPGDLTLFTKLTEFLGNRPMKAIASQELETILSGLNLLPDHPIHELTIDYDLESAIYSGNIDSEKILAKPTLRKISKEDFSKAKRNAEESGQKGEEIVNLYIEDLVNADIIKSFKWVSFVNPIFPYDFFIITNDDSDVYLDVKSTEGEFEREIYVSYNELKQMAHASQYDLYRIYKLKEKTAKLKICTNMKPFAEQILKTFVDLPLGVKSTGITFSPSILHFGNEINLEVFLPE